MKITVSEAQYIKWNELWLSVERLIAKWGDDGAHGSELQLALTDAERKGAAREEPELELPPPPVCATCGQVATNKARDLVHRLPVPERTYRIGEMPDPSPVGEWRYGCDSHPA